MWLFKERKSINSTLLKFLFNMKIQINYYFRIAYFRIALKAILTIASTRLFRRAVLFTITSFSQHAELLNVT